MSKKNRWKAEQMVAINDNESLELDTELKCPEDDVKSLKKYFVIRKKILKKDEKKNNFVLCNF